MSSSSSGRWYWRQAVTSSSRFSTRAWDFSPFSARYIALRPECWMAISACWCRGSMETCSSSASMSSTKPRTALPARPVSTLSLSKVLADCHRFWP
ncbi:hypothetical protein D3C79_899300 [compost metagenome]